VQLFLIRHAIAEDPRAGLRDAARALTKEGRERFEEEVRGLRQLGISFERLLHSPLRRALETAELLAPLVEGELEVSALLAAAPGPELVAQLAGARLALVGHEPWLSELAWMLVAGHADASGFALKKGGLLLLEGEPRPGGMRLVQALAPSTLRELGRG
jgi:phosphohistidine phosphatase